MKAHTQILVLVTLLAWAPAATAQQPPSPTTPGAEEAPAAATPAAREASPVAAPEEAKEAKGGGGAKEASAAATSAEAKPAPPAGHPAATPPAGPGAGETAPSASTGPASSQKKPGETAPSAPTGPASSQKKPGETEPPPIPTLPPGAGGPDVEKAMAEFDAGGYEDHPDHYPGMLRFSPAAGMDVAIRGMIQSFGGWVGDEALLSEGDLMQEPGFRMRRARLALEGNMLPQVAFNLEMDLYDRERNSGPLHQAWVDVTPFELIGATVGVQKLPFSQGEMLSSLHLDHLDKGIGTKAMSPVNAMGLLLHSEFWAEHGWLSFGVFNGIQRKPTFLQGYDGVGQTLGNRFERMLYVLKVDLEPLGDLGPEVADVYAEGALRIGLGGAAFYNDGQSIATSAMGGYLHLKGWGFHLFFEYMRDHNEPQAEPTSTGNVLAATVDHVAAQMDLGYMILPGRLGVALRMELLDAHTSRDDEGDEFVTTGTLTYYALRDMIKFMIEGTHRETLHGNGVANDAILGGLQIGF